MLGCKLHAVRVVFEEDDGDGIEDCAAAEGGGDDYVEVRGEDLVGVGELWLGGVSQVLCSVVKGLAYEIPASAVGG